MASVFEHSSLGGGGHSDTFDTHEPFQHFIKSPPQVLCVGHKDKLDAQEPSKHLTFEEEHVSVSVFLHSDEAFWQNPFAQRTGLSEGQVI